MVVELNMEMKTATLVDLPPEIVLNIISNLSDNDIFILGLVCRQLYSITSSYVELGNI